MKFFLLALLFISTNSAFADSASPWIEIARSRDLAHRTEWLRLLHYEPQWMGASQSPALGKLFFLSSNGGNDPEAELEATLKGFFREATEAERSKNLDVSVPGQPEIQPPQCQFPARLMWLHKELGFAQADLPKQDCFRFEHFRENIGAKSVTLVFSSYYLNNPSSAFGHTFLRLNKTLTPSSGTGADLLDYGINYAAVADTGNAVLYAFKGLAGMFPGTFTAVPYYYKVREYNDYESRDLWEYNLRFTPEQTDFLVAHIWELGSTYFRYYYLSKNCSYHVLALLDVMDPSLHLTDDLASIVIPADTVKVLNNVPGLVTSIHYRPSIRTQFDYRIGKLTDAELSALKELLDSRNRDSDFNRELAALSTGSLSRKSQVTVLDTAADYMDQHYSTELQDSEKKKSSNVGKWKQALLLARSDYSEPSEEVNVPVPLQEMPQNGHGSRRVSLDSGYSSEFNAFTTLNYRFALQDLTDPLEGYPSYAQLEMGGMRLRYNSAPSGFSQHFWPHIWVDEINLFKIISLNPLKPFDHKLSWTVSLGGKRFYDGICPGTCFGPSFEVGGGFAANPIQSVPLTVFLFGMGEVIASPEFPGAHLRPGIGPTAGVRYHESDNFGVTLQSGYRYRFFAGPHDSSFTQGVARFAFRKDLAVEAQVSQYFTGGVEGSSGFSYYY